MINTDAHRASEIEFMRYGVDQARRSWCCAKDVANMRPIEELRRLLRRSTRGPSRTPKPEVADDS